MRIGFGILFVAIVVSARAGEVTMSAAAAKIVELTNAERKKEHLPPFKTDALLFKVAQAHSENMAKQQKFSHKLDGKTPLQRLKAAGYQLNAAYENIGAGDADVPLPELMKAWMDSEGHRKNILNTVCTEIGIGIAKDKDGTVYYTQLFGTPKK